MITRPMVDGNGLAQENGDEALARRALARFEVFEPKLVFVFDQVSRRLLKIDGPCEEFFNVTPEQLSVDPMAWHCSIDPLDRALAEALREDLQRLGSLVRFVRATGRDGCQRNLRAALRLEQVEGRILVVGSVVALESVSEAQGASGVLRAAMEEAHEGIAVTDAEGCFLYLNREHLALFGYDSMAEVIGKSWRILYPDDVVRQFEQTVFPQLMAAGWWRGRLQAKRKDGSLFHEGISLSLLKNGGIVCNCTDVSPEIELAGQLARSEAMFRTFLNTLPTGVIIRNLTGEYEFVNRAIVSFFNRELDCRESAVSLSALLQENQIFDYWVAVGNRVAATGAAERFDFPLTWGGRAWVLDVEKRPLRIGSSEVTHVCTLVRDVTDERRMATESKETARRRDEYLVMQREFISMVSHEFRTPLTAIQGLQYLMSMSVDGSGKTKPEAMARWLDLQGQALGTLKELVDQVLLLNRIEHLSSAAPQKMPLRAFLTKTLRAAAAGSRLKFELDLPEDFAALISEPQLRAMVENLVSNGLKYSAKDVTVRAGVDGDHWWLAVSDRGRGIPERDQAKLFEPFFRASNVGNVAGTGLGLTIVKRCAAYHRGTLSLESQEGRGTQFTVRFPLDLRSFATALPFMQPPLPAKPGSVMPENL